MMLRLPSPIRPTPRTARVRARHTAVPVQPLEPRLLFAAGDLDPTFGGDGLVVTSPGLGSDVAVQADGKIVAVGMTTGGMPRQALLARFNTNGTPDASFGGNGRVAIGVPGVNDEFRRVVIAPGGDILVAGSVLARFNPDGTLDRSFGGGDGIVDFADVSGNTLSATALAVRPDGKFAMAYYDYREPLFAQVVSRFNPDGSLDATFGTGGTVHLPPEPGSPFGRNDVNGVSFDAGGKLVVAGTELRRYNDDGTLDPTFGSDGIIRPTVPGTLEQYSTSTSLVVRPDGRVVVGFVSARASDERSVGGLLQINRDGTIDKGFGLYGTGVGYNPLEQREHLVGIHDLALAPDGKFVAAGAGQTAAEPPTPGGGLPAVARYRADGSPDPSFSGDGVAMTDDSYPFDPGIYEGVALDTAGRPVAVSGTYINIEALSVVRLQADANRDGINLSGGDTLTVEGTKNADSISVTRSGDNLVAKVNSTTRSFPASQVKRLFVFGNEGNDNIVIGSGGVIGASVDAGDGNDRVSGGGGNDTLDGGLGADYLVGGGGSDTVSYFRRWDGVSVNPDNVAQDGESSERDNVRSDVENFIGGHGDDRLTGNSKANYLFGNDGNDTLRGLFGNDRIDGGLGADFMSGGDGVDTIDYSHRPGNNDAGALRLTVTLGDGAANDGTAGEGDNAQADNVIGNIGADRLVGSNNDNVLDGGLGDDTLVGGAGNDSLLGGSGFDTLDGGTGNDLFDGGTPYYPGTPDVDTADYSSRTDDLVIDLTNNSNVTPAGERDRFVSVENAVGGARHDRLVGDGNYNVLTGNDGNDTLVGNAGNDTLDGGSGADRFEGGAGTDTADYSRRGEDLVVSIDNAANDGAAGEKDDVRTDVENVDGGRGNDRLTGSSAANMLRSMAGNDTLDGGAGNDTLFGGAGNDTLTGGADKDRLVGEDGDDTFFARDGFADVLDGRAGNDKAQKDGIDTTTSIETLLP